MSEGSKKGAIAMADKKLLELRKGIKSRKPAMVRQDWYKKKRLAKAWRRPKGLHSKFRHRRKERGGFVEPGWGSPREAKGLHGSGLEVVVVSSVAELEKLAGDRQGVVIGAAVGARKRMDIVKTALQKKINVLNLKNAAEWVAKKELEMEERKKAKTQKGIKAEAKAGKKPEEKKPEEKKPEEKKPEAKSAEAKKPGAKAPETEEEKREQEKREKDKLLTKREI